VKRIFGLALCLTAVSTAQAEPKLRLIELSDDRPLSAEDADHSKHFMAVQEAAQKIKPEEARDFLKRLNETVEQGQTMAASSTMDSKQARNHAIALGKLKNEGEHFGVMLAPFAKCNSAAINAASSWQGLIFNNEQQYSNGHTSYQAAAKECAKAAN
jgi:hypothetical protein